MKDMKRFASKLSSRAPRTNAPAAASCDFFILHDPSAAEEAVQVLSGLLTSEGYSVQTNAEDGPMRKQMLQSKVVIFYLTSDALLNKEVASALKAAAKQAKRMMVVHETDEEAGAILKRRSRRSVDLPKMLNLEKSKLKNFRLIRSLPFRTQLSYARYAALSLVRSIDLSAFPETTASMQRIKSAEHVQGSREWVYSALNDWATDANNSTVMTLVGQEGSGKSVISATLGESLPKSTQTVCYFFNELDHLSRNARVCIEYLATKLSQVVPGFHRVHFRYETATLQERLNYLILEPARVTKSMRSNSVVIVLDGIDQCLSHQKASLIHLFQTAKLPSWIKVMVTGKPSILKYGTANSTVLDLDESGDSAIDFAQFLERCFRTHLLSTPEEYRVGVRAGTEAAQGNFFYLNFVENLLKQHPGMTLSSIDLPASSEEITKALLQDLKAKSGGLPLRMILAILLAAREPVPVSLIQRICDIQLVAIEDIFSSSPLFYVMNGKVQFSRRAFKSFLASPSNGEYHVNGVDGHVLLAEWCLKFTGIDPKEQSIACAAREKGLDEGELLEDQGDKDFETNSEFVAFGYNHLVYHLCQAQRFEEVHTALTQFPWLLACVQNSPRLLLQDLQAYFSPDLSPADKAVHTITTSLRMSLDALQRDPRELASQLLGRLNAETPGCAKLLEAASKYSPGEGVTWWRPLQPTLEQADDKRTREVHLEGEVRTCAVSPDGRIIAASGSDNVVCLFQGHPASGSGHLLKSLKGHSERVNDVQFAPDSSRLASASNDTTAIVWDVTTGEKLYVLKAHITGVHHLSFTADGNFLITTSQLSARVWDLSAKESEEDEEESSLSTVPNPKCLGIHRKSDAAISIVRTSRSDTDEYALGFEDGKVKVLSVREPESEPVSLEDGHRRAVTSLLFPEQKPKILVTGSFDRTICVWDLSQLVQQLKLKVHNEKVTSLSFLNGHLVTTSLESDGLKFWNLQQEEPTSL